MITSEVNEQTIRQFIQIDRLHHTLLDKNVSRTGLHRTQHTLLYHIAKCETPPTQKDLAQAFQVSSAAITVTLQKLESAGFIERITEPGDQRCRRILVTQKGRTILEESKKLAHEVDEKMFSDFSEEERRLFSACLEKIRQNLLEAEKELKL